MKNNFLSKAYGGVMEARNKLYGLGLPRQWKVITSTLLLLFTFAIGQMWGQTFRYYIAISNDDATSVSSGKLQVFKTSDDEHFENVTSQFTLNSNYSTSSAPSNLFYNSSYAFSNSSTDAILKGVRYTKNKTFTINWTKSILSFNKITFQGFGASSKNEDLTVKNSTSDAGETVTLAKGTTITPYEVTKNFTQENGITIVSANTDNAYAITILHAVDHAEITSTATEMVTSESLQMEGFPSGGTWSIAEGGTGTGSITSGGVLTATANGTIKVKYAKDGYGEDIKTITVSDTRSIYWFAAGATDATTAGVAHNATFFTIPTTDRSGQSGNVTLDETEYTLTKRASTTTTQCTFTIPSGTEGALYMAAVSSGSTNHTIRIQKTGDASPTDIGTLTGGSSSWSAISKTGLTAGTYTVTSSGNTRPGMLIMKLSAATPVEYYTVTLNPAGGSIDPVPSGWTLTDGKYIKADVEDGSSVDLLALTKSGYLLDGWKDGESTDYTSPVTIDGADLTLTAQWAQTYAVTYVPNNGVLPAETMTDNNAPYKAGDEVTLLANTFTAPENKEFDEWVATYNDGEVKTLTITAGKFTMPAYPVTVTATWKDACALAPTVSATTLGTTSYTTQVVNCAGISVLGSAGCTISEYGFVYGTTTAPTISNNKKALEGDYTVAGTAFPATTLTGLAMNTKYYVRAYATNSFGTAYGAEVEFTTLAPLGNVLVVASSAGQTSDAITALRDNGFIVTVSAPNNSRDYTGYDLVVLDESLSGGNGVAGKEEGDIKGVNIPLLNLKSFFYNSGRWGWGTGNNGTADNEIAKIPATYKNAQSHPIFAGLTITDGNIDLIDPAKTGNTLQTATGLVAGKEGYVLATVGGNAFIHELTPAQRGVTDAKYLMVAISNNAKDNLSADGELLIVNAAKYLIGSTAWVPQYYTVSFDPHGGDPIAPRTGNPGITLPETEYGTQSFLGWFTEETGGTKIGEAGDSYTPTADITLHAHWEAVSTDARLASITFSSDAGTLSPAFDPEVTIYTYTMPYGTAAVPTITGATSVSAKAQEPQIVSQASAWGETAVIRGVAESSDSKAYNITMLRAPKDGVCLVWADVPADNTLTYNATNSKFYAESDVTLQNSNVKGKDGSAPSGKKFQSNGFLKIALNEGTFLEGDVVALNVTYGTANVMHVFKAQAATSTDVIGEAAGNTDAGLNKVAITEDAATLWLVRGGEYADWNPHVDYVAVYRIMNPILKAITINSRAGEIDALNDHHFSVLIPYDADLAALTIVPTIIRNAPHATTPEAVISNAGAWIEGANTYRVMDKDGDYTDYTITLTRDVLKHSVSFNTHGGSAIDPVEVAHGEYLLAAPADPTKDENVFKFWSETEDGAEVDITTVQINADKTFHAVWEAEPAGIKLINGDVVNHTNFLTGTNETTVEIESVEHKCVDFTTAGSNRTTVASISDLKEFIQYNATTNKAKIKLTLYNTKSSPVSAYLHMLEEGSETPTTEEISIPAGEVLKTDFYEFNSEKNRSFYITCGNRDYIKVLQVKVIDDGTTTLKKAGQVGYSVNTLKSRIFAPQQSAISFEGLTINANAVCKPLSTTAMKIKNAYNISFHADAAMTLAVTTDGNQTYYVSATADGTTNETSFTGRKEFDITAGDWYIHAGGSELKVAKLEFALPKAEEPTITTQPASNHTFGPGNLTATVEAEVSDGGTLSYKWYDASDDSEVTGQTTATLTTTTEGTYYVIVTNSLAGHQDNSSKSDEATLAYRDASDATLSALTVSEGTLAPTFDPAELNYRVDLPEGTVDVPTLTATATMAGFADVVIFNEGSFTNYEAVSTVTVTSEDLSDTKVYTVHFYVAHAIATLVDVTENTTWDWTLVTKKKDGTTISGDGPIVTEAEDGLVIANYLLGENFDKVEGNNGAYALRSDSRKVYQGASLHIHTTKGGYLSIWAANEGTTQTLNVANEGRDMKLATLTGSQVEYKVYVNAGDVVIYNIPETSGKPMRVSKMIFTVDETPDYTRTEMLGAGVYGTICVDHNVPVGGVHGVTVYEIAGREPQYGKIAFDEVTEMEAGVPYVFIAHGNEMALYYGETTVADPVNGNGMYGTFMAQTLTELDGIYYFAKSALWSCVDLTSLNLPANRAYVKLSEINYLGSSAPAPGRKRLMIGVNGAPAVATGLENGELMNDAMVKKVLINGQLFILRGEKMYDAKGQLVK